MHCTIDGIHLHNWSSTILAMSIVNDDSEFPDRQDGCLACWRLQGRFPLSLHCFMVCMHEALRGYCPLGGGAANQLDQGIWDLSKVYLPVLLERVSAGEVLEVDSNLSTCINFKVFSFVMAYNNKNVGGLFRCNFTFRVPNQQVWFSKFPVFKNIWIYPIRF